MNYIIMVLTSLIWWSLCIQSQIELEPQDFRTCTETFRAKSCRWKCIFNIALLFVNISSNITSFFRFLTSTIPSWFRRYGNQRCCFLRVFCNTTQNLHCNFIFPLARFTFQMPRRQSSSMLRFPIYFWASSPLVRFYICSGLNFHANIIIIFLNHYQPYKH